MDLSKIMSGYASAKFTGISCGFCGAQTSIASGSNDCFCTYCESYLASSASMQGDPSLRAVHLMASQNRIDDAAKALDAISPGSDPVRLYAISSIYSALSDLRYADVNYSLPGFMYQNADNRNDEYNKNPNNSMRLLSKSKEMLFDAIYLINNQLKSNDTTMLYLEFMCETRLDRHAKAYKVLDRMLTTGGVAADYAAMVYAVEANEKDADQLLGNMLKKKELAPLYYLSRHLIASKDLEQAEMVLRFLQERVRMPSAWRLLRKIEAVNEATRL